MPYRRYDASDSNGDRYMDFVNKAKLFECVCKIGSRVDGIHDLPFFELVDKNERLKLINRKHLQKKDFYGYSSITNR